MRNCERCGRGLETPEQEHAGLCYVHLGGGGDGFEDERELETLLLDLLQVPLWAGHDELDCVSIADVRGIEKLVGSCGDEADVQPLAQARPGSPRRGVLLKDADGTAWRITIEREPRA